MLRIHAALYIILLIASLVTQELGQNQMDLPDLSILALRDNEKAMSERGLYLPLDGPTIRNSLAR